MEQNELYNDNINKIRSIACLRNEQLKDRQINYANQNFNKSQSFTNISPQKKNNIQSYQYNQNGNNIASHLTSSHVKENKALKQLKILSDKNEKLSTKFTNTTYDGLSGWDNAEIDELNIFTNKVKQNQSRIGFVPKYQPTMSQNKIRVKSALPEKRLSSNSSQEEQFQYASSINQQDGQKCNIDELKKLRDMYNNSSPEKQVDQQMQIQQQSSPWRQDEQFLLKLRSCSVNQQDVSLYNKRYYDDIRGKYIVQKHENLNNMQNTYKDTSLLHQSRSKQINEILETQANEEMSDQKKTANYNYRSNIVASNSNTQQFARQSPDILLRNNISGLLITNRVNTINSNYDSPNQQFRTRKLSVKQKRSSTTQIQQMHGKTMLNNTQLCIDPRNLEIQECILKQQQNQQQLSQPSYQLQQIQIQYQEQKILQSTMNKTNVIKDVKDWQSKVKEVLELNETQIFQKRKNYLQHPYQEEKKVPVPIQKRLQQELLVKNGYINTNIAGNSKTPQEQGCKENLAPLKNHIVKKMSGIQNLKKIQFLSYNKKLNLQNDGIILNFNTNGNYHNNNLSKENCKNRNNVDEQDSSQQDTIITNKVIALKQYNLHLSKQNLPKLFKNQKKQVLKKFKLQKIDQKQNLINAALL